MAGTAGTDADICIGGISGMNADTSIITNCYNTGDVSIAGTDADSFLYIGGISGMGFEESIITNCYNTGDVSVTDNYYYCFLGGVIGTDYSIDNITNNYYLNTTCDDSIWNSNVAGSTEAKTTEQFANGEVAYLL
ncbi:MAG: GLUG motif-containing protein [Acutalibacteraceae bacterium]|nr:GLUG motif-containing protein [Acutalibacteraceae bacterium]